MMITIVIPMPLVESGDIETDNANRMINEKKIDTHIKHKLKLEKKFTKVYSFFKSQCTKATKVKLKSNGN